MIKVTNLKKIYGEKVILRNITFEINRGDVVSILGSNGAGKTTLIKCLTKLLNYNGGDIFYNGKSLRLYKNEYYRDISVVLEGDRNLYWYLTGKENVLYFARLLKMKDKDTLERLDYLSNLFELKKDLDRRVSEYSRGMKQKLSIIIALINSPKVIFLDEPTLGLDINSKRILEGILKYLKNNEDLTVILTSHEAGIIESLSDKILFLEDGMIKYYNDIDDLKDIFSKESYIVEIKGKLQCDIESFLITSIEYDDINDVSTLKVSLDKNSSYDFIRFMVDNNYNIISFQKYTMDFEDIIANMCGGCDDKFI